MRLCRNGGNAVAPEEASEPPLQAPVWPDEPAERRWWQRVCQQRQRDEAVPEPIAQLRLAAQQKERERAEAEAAKLGPVAVPAGAVGRFRNALMCRGGTATQIELPLGDSSSESDYDANGRCGDGGRREVCGEVCDAAAGQFQQRV
eukprot:353460-Chlamydomonas_euryale.AAC.1